MIQISQNKTKEQPSDLKPIGKKYLQKQPKVYFERQNKNLLCGLHAVNNFLGAAKFTVDSMNRICEQLAQGKKLFNPHRHWLLQGDFDINVLMTALAKQNYQTKWHDKRIKWKNHPFNEFQGYLLNIEYSSGFLSCLGAFCCNSRRHWLSVKKISNFSQKQQLYAILDSVKDKYEIVTQSQLIEKLQNIQKNEGQVICILKNPENGMNLPQNLTKKAN